MSEQAAIRRAAPGDAPALARMRLSFRGEVEPPSEDRDAFLSRCEQWMASRLAPGGAWRCWVAESSQGIVGTAWLQLVEKLPNPVAEPERHAYVSSLYVVPERRGSGLGTALLARCLEDCDRSDVDAVLLWPTPQSRTLYLRHGFAAGDDLLQRRG